MDERIVNGSVFRIIESKLSFEVFYKILSEFQLTDNHYEKINYPKDGQLFLYYSNDSIKAKDYLSDGYKWENQSCYYFPSKYDQRMKVQFILYLFRKKVNLDTTFNLCDFYPSVLSFSHPFRNNYTILVNIRNLD